jgi:hypothetical protein
MASCPLTAMGRLSRARGTARSHRPSRRPPPAGSHRLQLIYKKAPLYSSGALAGSPRDPQALQSYGIAARLGRASRGVSDFCVGHRTPDIRGKDRSWLRSVSPGDDDTHWLRGADILAILFHPNSHFIDALVPLPPVGTPYAKLGLICNPLLANYLGFQGLIQLRYECRKLTLPRRTGVSFGHLPQLAIFFARKLLDEPESASTEIDQPLYCRRSSATETPRLPLTIVPTR